MNDFTDLRCGEDPVTLRASPDRQRFDPAVGLPETFEILNPEQIIGVLHETDNILAGFPRRQRSHRGRKSLRIGHSAAKEGGHCIVEDGILRL